MYAFDGVWASHCRTDGIRAVVETFSMNCCRFAVETHLSVVTVCKNYLHI